MGEHEGLVNDDTSFDGCTRAGLRRRLAKEKRLRISQEKSQICARKEAYAKGFRAGCQAAAEHCRMLARQFDDRTEVQRQADIRPRETVRRLRSAAKGIVSIPAPQAPEEAEGND